MRVTVVISGIPQFVTLKDLAFNLNKSFDTNEIGMFAVRDLPNNHTKKRQIALDFDSGYDAMYAQNLLDGKQYTLPNGEMKMLHAKINNKTDIISEPLPTPSKTLNRSARKDSTSSSVDDDLPILKMSKHELQKVEKKMDAQLTVLEKQKQVLLSEHQLLMEKRRLEMELKKLEAEESAQKKRRRSSLSESQPEDQLKTKKKRKLKKSSRNHRENSPCNIRDTYCELQKIIACALSGSSFNLSESLTRERTNSSAHEMLDYSASQLRKNSTCDIREGSPRVSQKTSTCHLRESSSHVSISSSTCDVRENSHRVSQKSSTCHLRESSPHVSKRSSTCDVKEGSTCHLRKSSPCVSKRSSTCDVKEGSTCHLRESSPCVSKRSSTCDVKEGSTCHLWESSPCVSKRISTCDVKEGSTCHLRERSPRVSKRSSTCDVKEGSTCHLRERSPRVSKRSSTCDVKEGSTCHLRERSPRVSKRSSTHDVKESSTCHLRENSPRVSKRSSTRDGKETSPRVSKRISTCRLRDSSTFDLEESSTHDLREKLKHKARSSEQSSKNLSRPVKYSHERIFREYGPKSHERGYGDFHSRSSRMRRSHDRQLYSPPASPDDDYRRPSWRRTSGDHCRSSHERSPETHYSRSSRDSYSRDHYGRTRDSSSWARDKYSSSTLNEVVVCRRSPVWIDNRHWYEPKSIPYPKRKAIDYRPNTSHTYKRADNYNHMERVDTREKAAHRYKENIIMDMEKKNDAMEAKVTKAMKLKQENNKIKDALETKKEEAIKEILLENEKLFNNLSLEYKVTEADKKRVLKKLFEQIRGRMDKLLVTGVRSVSNLIMRYKCEYEIVDVHLVTKLFTDCVSTQTVTTTIPGLESTSSSLDPFWNEIESVLQDIEIDSLNDDIKPNIEMQDENDEGEVITNITINLKAIVSEKSKPDDLQGTIEEDIKCNINITIDRNRVPKYYITIRIILKNLKSHMMKYRKYVEFTTFEYVVRGILEEQITKLLIGQSIMRAKPLYNLYRTLYPVEGDHAFVLQVFYDICEGKYNDKEPETSASDIDVSDKPPPEKENNEVSNKIAIKDEETLNNTITRIDSDVTDKENNGKPIEETPVTSNKNCQASDISDIPANIKIRSVDSMDSNDTRDNVPSEIVVENTTNINKKSDIRQTEKSATIVKIERIDNLVSDNNGENVQSKIVEDTSNIVMKRDEIDTEYLPLNVKTEPVEDIVPVDNVHNVQSKIAVQETSNIEKKRDSQVAEKLATKVKIEQIDNLVSDDKITSVQSTTVVEKTPKIEHTHENKDAEKSANNIKIERIDNLVTDDKCENVQSKMVVENTPNIDQIHTEVSTNNVNIEQIDDMELDDNSEAERLKQLSAEVKRINIIIKKRNEKSSPNVVSTNSSDDIQSSSISNSIVSKKAPKDKKNRKDTEKSSKERVDNVFFVCSDNSYSDSDEGQSEVVSEKTQDITKNRDNGGSGKATSNVNIDTEKSINHREMLQAKDGSNDCDINNYTYVAKGAMKVESEKPKVLEGDKIIKTGHATGEKDDDDVIFIGNCTNVNELSNIDANSISGDTPVQAPLEEDVKLVEPDFVCIDLSDDEMPFFGDEQVKQSGIVDTTANKNLDNGSASDQNVALQRAQSANSSDLFADEVVCVSDNETEDESPDVNAKSQPTVNTSQTLKNDTSTMNAGSGSATLANQIDLDDSDDDGSVVTVILGEPNEMDDLSVDKETKNNEHAILEPNVGDFNKQNGRCGSGEVNFKKDAFKPWNPSVETSNISSAGDEDIVGENQIRVSEKMTVGVKEGIKSGGLNELIDERITEEISKTCAERNKDFNDEDDYETVEIIGKFLQSYGVNYK